MEGAGGGRAVAAFAVEGETANRQRGAADHRMRIGPRQETDYLDLHRFVEGPGSPRRRGGQGSFSKNGMRKGRQGARMVRRTGCAGSGGEARPKAGRPEPPRLDRIETGVNTDGAGARSSATSAIPGIRAAPGRGAATSRPRWAPASASRSRRDAAVEVAGVVDALGLGGELVDGGGIDASRGFCARSMSRSSRHRPQRKSPSALFRYAQRRQPPWATWWARRRLQDLALRSRHLAHTLARVPSRLRATVRWHRVWQQVARPVSRIGGPDDAFRELAAPVGDEDFEVHGESPVQA